MLCFADMMRKQIVMPAHLMCDGEHEQKNGGRNLFADFSAVAESTKTYTAFDYADIMEHLVKRWDIMNMNVSIYIVEQSPFYLCRGGRGTDQLSSNPEQS